MFASVADKQSVDTFPWGVWSMNCFRGNHPHLNGHVYSSIALPTDGKKKLNFDCCVVQSYLLMGLCTEMVKKSMCLNCTLRAGANTLCFSLFLNLKTPSVELVD